MRDFGVLVLWPASVLADEATDQARRPAPVPEGRPRQQMFLAIRLDQHLMTSSNRLVTYGNITRNRWAGPVQPPPCSAHERRLTE